jgi:iron(III) transport system substrate-binding protein
MPLCRRLLLAGLATPLIAPLAAPHVARAQARRPVMIYSAVAERIHVPLVRAFEAKHPEYEVKAVLGSNGPIAARAIAEKANPQCDALYSFNIFFMQALKREAVFAPYQPRGSRIAEDFRDPDDFFVSHWITVNGFLVNTRIASQRGIEIPRTWADLTKPAYRGLVSAPSPTRSGTGLTVFTALVDAFGWEYLDALHANIPAYGSGGSVAARQAAAGELMVGITFDTTLLELKASGAPVEIVFPDMIPNVTEGGGLAARGPNPEGGKAFCDFLASPEGAELYKPFTGATTTPGIGNLNLAELNLWKMQRPVDLDAFRREWARRYER